MVNLRPPVNQPLGPLDLCQYAEQHAELNRPGVSGHLTSPGKAKVKLTATRPSNNYPPELREGAILLNWVRRAQVDAGQRPGLLQPRRPRYPRLRAKVNELRAANEILRMASASFAARSRPPTRLIVNYIGRIANGSGRAELSRAHRARRLDR